MKEIMRKEDMEEQEQLDQEYDERMSKWPWRKWKAGEVMAALIIGGCISLFPVFYLVTLAFQSSKIFVALPTAISTIVYIWFILWRIVDQGEIMKYNKLNKQKGGY